jgi:lipopolysaccharide biosynthesis glycosyltransferase
MNKIQKLLAKASNLIASGNYADAKKEYESLIKEYPDMVPIVRGRLALIEAKEGNRDVKANISMPNEDNRDIKANISIPNLDIYVQVRDSGLWDEQWYVTQYYDSLIDMPSSVSPLEYYINGGWKKGHLPSRHFKIKGNPFSSELTVNHVTHFLNVLRYAGYHFDDCGPRLSSELLSQYVSFRRSRRSSKVVYTCIVGSYNSLVQPSSIDFEWDYVCFTDSQLPNGEKFFGVWELRPLCYFLSSPSRTNRWHKINPHLLFPEYEESIYIDGNINIVGDYCYRIARGQRKKILVPRHFKRECIYEEVRAVKASRRFSSEDKILFSEQERFLRDEGFPQNYGLSENNFIYRKHNDKEIIAMMNLWLWVLTKYSGRDQLGLSYCFWRYGLDIRKHLIENCRINYKNFRVVAHDEKIYKNDMIVNKLTPTGNSECVLVVFSCNDTFVPYLAIAMESLVAHTSGIYHYDIVILYSDLGDGNIEKLGSIATTNSNVTIRFYCMEQLVSGVGNDLFPVDGYVPRETYNKCFLSEIFSGYGRCLYLDSDILICDDVAKLFYMDMNSKPIAASRNVANINAAYLNKEVKGVQFRDYLTNVLGVSDYEEYFQAGVVLLDLDRLRDWRLLERSVSALKDIKKPLFYDQCVFNKLFYKEVEFFSTSWNHVWYLQNYSYLRSSMPRYIYYDYAKGRSFPKIIHYASGDKYYNKPDWILADRFWRFAQGSMFYADILEDCKRRLNNEAHQKLIGFINGKSWKKQKILVHLHLYYPDQLEYMLAVIDQISGVDMDLYVTQVTRNKPCEVLIHKKYPDAKILTLENGGYDVYPFLVVLKQGRLSQYDYILKLHTKNSRQPGQDSVYGVPVPGNTWRDKLIEALLRDQTTFLSCLKILSNDESVGCVAAKEFIFSTSDNNEERNYNLPYWRGRLALSCSEHYVGGSMFLARAYPFEKLLSSGVSSEDFSSPSYATKDSKNLGHVFERLLGLVIGSEGLLIYGK